MGFFQFEIIINVLVSFSPVHLNTYAMGLRPFNYLTLSVRGPELDVRI